MAAAAEEVMTEHLPPDVRRPVGAREVKLGAAVFSAFLVILLGHGLLPGLVTDAPSRYLMEGAIQCVHDLGVGALKPWCHDYGEPLGYPLLTNGPPVVLGALLAWIPGVTAGSAVVFATALFDAVALLGAFALMRRLGARSAVALGAALAYLLSPTVVGLGSFPGTFTGFALLPAYAFVDLWAIDAVRSGRTRLITAAAAVYVGVKGGALFMDGYSFVVANLLSVLLWGRWLVAERPTRQRALTGAALLVGANLIAVLVYRSYVPGSTPPAPVDLFRAMGLDAITLAAPTEMNWLAAALGLDADHSDLWGDGTNSSFNYAGVACLFLAAIYLARRPRRGDAVMFAVAGAIGLVLALGPSLKLDDPAADTTERVTYESYLMPESAATLTFPWSGLFTGVAGLEDMRASYRWFALARLALIVLAALAIERLLQTRRWRVAAVVAGTLALVELAPNLSEVVSQYRANDRTVSALKGDVLPDLRAVTEPGDSAFFVSYDASHNDFIVNYLAAAADLPSYNAGGDKNVFLSRAQWPSPIQPLAAAQPPADAVAAALASRRVDVVIYPFFHLRWAAYQWPPSPRERAAARRPLAPVARDPPLRVGQRSTLAAVRLADR